MPATAEQRSAKILQSHMRTRQTCIVAGLSLVSSTFIVWEEKRWCSILADSECIHVIDQRHRFTGSRSALTGSPDSACRAHGLNFVLRKFKRTSEREDVLRMCSECLSSFHFRLSCQPRAAGESFAFSGKLVSISNPVTRGALYWLLFIPGEQKPLYLLLDPVKPLQYRGSPQCPGQGRRDMHRCGACQGEVCRLPVMLT